VGGNVGSASGPLLAAFVVVPRGQSSIAWFALAALVAMVVLLPVAGWYARHRGPRRPAPTPARTAGATPRESALPRRRVATAVVVLDIF
jgi:MFS transporter, FSR family, fosmidomycin resistance protein